VTFNLKKRSKKDLTLNQTKEKAAETK
jgi:hypothetical protein